MKVPDPRAPGAFAVVVLVGFVVARFLAVALHEVVGHGVFAIAMGGSFYGVYVSPASGFAFVFLGAQPSAAASVTDAMAGILVEVLAGLLVLRLYPRARTFLGRLFLLLLLEALLVYSLVYLALGAFEPAGDPAQAAAYLGLWSLPYAAHLVWAFGVIGAVWATAIAVYLSREVLILVAPRATARRQMLLLSLFWFTPLASAALPSLLFYAAASISASLVLYFVLFLGVGGAVFGIAAVLASRVAPSHATPPRRPLGSLAPLAVAILVVVPLWIVPFGPTDATAHGVLFAEPPLAAEPSWAGSVAVNVDARIDAARNLTLAFRFKGILDTRSPLEAQAAASYEDRADLPYWSNYAVTLATAMTNVTTWSVTSAGIEENGTAWLGGGTVAHPRLVVLTAWAVDVQRLVAVIRSEAPEVVTLRLQDPWQSDPTRACPSCYVDEVNVSWQGHAGGVLAYRLVQVREQGGYADRAYGYDAAADAYFVRFRNGSADHAPAAYQLTWEWLAAP